MSQGMRSLRGARPTRVVANGSSGRLRKRVTKTNNVIKRGRLRAPPGDRGEKKNKLL